MKKMLLLFVVAVSFLFVKDVSAISIYNQCKSYSYSEVENFFLNHKETIQMQTDSNYFAYCTVAGYDFNKPIEQMTRIAIGCTFDDASNYKSGKETNCKQYFEVYKSPDSSLQLYHDPSLKIPYSFPSYYQHINVISLKDENNSNVLTYLFLIGFVATLIFVTLIFKRRVYLQ